MFSVILALNLGESVSIAKPNIKHFVGFCQAYKNNQ